MSGLEAALTALLARLVEQDASFAIVGGLAVSARTEPRFTRDADVCVAVEKVLARDDVERPQDRVDLVALLRVGVRSGRCRSAPQTHR